MSDWRPIETADKETVSSVILYNGHVFSGFYDDAGDEKGWLNDSHGDRGVPVDPQPTFWMPFPEPPQ